jgi:hypothetical protein
MSSHPRKSFLEKSGNPVGYTLEGDVQESSRQYGRGVIIRGNKLRGANPTTDEARMNATTVSLGMSEKNALSQHYSM